MTATTSRIPYMWYTVWTAVTGENIKLQFKSEASTVGVDQSSIAVISLNDFTEDTDWFFNEETADATLAGTYGTLGGATGIHTTSGTTDWLVLGTASIDPTSITAPQKTRLDVSGGVTDVGVEWQQEGEDATVDRMVHTLAKVYSTTSNTLDIDVDTESSSASGTRLYESVFALNLDKFQDYGFQINQAEISLDTTNALATSTNIATASFTPSQTGDVYVLGFAIQDVGATAELIKYRLQTDNVDTPATQTSDTYNYVEAWDTTDELPFMMQNMTSLSTSSHTFDLDATKSTTARPSEDRLIVAFTMEKNSATSYTQNLSDGAKSGDGITKVLENVKNISDGAKAGDILTKVLTATRNLVDGGTAGDSITTSQSIGYTQSLVDGGTAGDSLTSIQISEFIQNISDGAIAGDSVSSSQIFGFTQNLSDGGTAGDTVSSSQTFGFIENLSDGGSVGDSIVKILTANRDLSDGGTAGDSITIDSNFSVTQNLSDGAKAGDSIVSAMIDNFIQNISDGAIAGEVFAGFIDCDVTCEITFTDGAVTGEVIVNDETNVVSVYNAIKLSINAPTETRKGGVFAFTCPAGEWAYGIDTNGNLLCADPTP